MINGRARSRLYRRNLNYSGGEKDFAELVDHFKCGKLAQPKGKLIEEMLHRDIPPFHGPPLLSWFKKGMALHAFVWTTAR